MKKYFGMTILSIFGAVLLAGLLVMFHTENSAAQAPVSTISREDDGNYQYWIKDYNGMLAVFGEEQDEPELVFQVYTRNLPKYDQENLQSGIGIKDYQELIARIEDFIS